MTKRQSGRKWGKEGERLDVVAGTGKKGEQGRWAAGRGRRGAGHHKPAHSHKMQDTALVARTARTQAPLARSPPRPPAPPPVAKPTHETRALLLIAQRSRIGFHIPPTRSAQRSRTRGPPAGLFLLRTVLKVMLPQHNINKILPLER